MLELVRSTKAIKLDEQTYNLKTITKAQAIKHEALVKEAGDETGPLLKAFSDLLVELGLPTEVVEGLELSHFKAIGEYLFDSKKK
jgi:hypothetical protein